MERAIGPRDRMPGWRASIAGIGVVVAMTAGVALVGLALSVGIWLVTP